MEVRAPVVVLGAKEVAWYHVKEDVIPHVGVMDALEVVLDAPEVVP